MERNSSNSPESRRKIAFLSIFGITQLHYRNPYVVAWWSAAFPGLGHMLLSKYIRGFLLFIWEVVINLKAHLNMGIFYTFTGNFKAAQEVLDIRWLLLYNAVYIFSIWDSYRAANDVNNSYELAAREDAEIQPFIMNSLELNYLDRKIPWVSAMWSFLMPGTGQLYNHRIVAATFMFVWWIVILYYSKVLPAIHFTFTGGFEMARSVVDEHWAMNISSVYMFSVYDAYMNTVENNKLFEWEQSQFLKKHYQNSNFTVPGKNITAGGDQMYIISTFEHSIFLEKAVTAIQMRGIAKEDILAVPLDKRAEQRKLFDSIHQSDGLSLMDLASILGTIFMLLGTIYGFLLKFGPVFWGMAGLIAGFSLGLAIKLLILRKSSRRQDNKKVSEVVLIIDCVKDKAEMVADTLWNHHALGVSRLDLN
ncbi:hypothetical protein CLHUN_21300 [Ruminiclostridium hungatei]|uniref:Uncharacterized protein n=1 Tax=Ruminiclostridium hungatei TaxID=48256 RepID=A0A1V4SJ22_RUMHU|nr:hypothetical protein [Ruminiclostridium hungatei]OPX43889.1 hypothetical protein CLHUN_21300 [Ruminiclostridium hungatei]